jgi:hypothetical protein
VIYLSLRQWSGQFGSPKVMGKIRRSIKAWVDLDMCVLVVEDGAVGITPEVRSDLERDWPAGKVVFSRTHPSAGPWSKQRRKRRRPL